MNILLLGSGGREHALAWKIAASPLVERLYCAPGNAGIAHEAELVALDTADHAAVIGFCKSHGVDLVVVGPEGPLCAGIVDELAGAGIKAFGPTRAAARLAAAQDHKRVFDGERGPNTGGMGAYSPTPALTDEHSRRVMDEIVMPTLRAMQAMGTPYRGVLYAGLMLTASGPKLIEYNV